MSPAPTRDVHLGEDETEGQSGPLPSYPQTLGPGALSHLWHDPAVRTEERPGEQMGSEVVMAIEQLRK